MNHEHSVFMFGSHVTRECLCVGILRSLRQGEGLRGARGGAAGNCQAPGFPYDPQDREVGQPYHACLCGTNSGCAGESRVGVGKRLETVRWREGER